MVAREGSCLVICSGFGEQSQWYRNVMAQPDIDITFGSTRGPVRVVRLPPGDGIAQMLRYAELHPRAAKRLAGLMGFPADGREESYREVGRGLPFLRLCPRGRRDD